MRRRLSIGFRLLVVVALGATLATVPTPADADHNADRHRKMDVQFTSPNSRINSDLAFWGDFAFSGYYRNDISVGGFRIFDISDPAAPQQLVDFPCDGLQADPIVWDRNDNGVPDLLLLAVDRTMEGPECGAARTADHADPDGWEGVRVFELSDDPANPFETIEQVQAVYTDCGAHTITLYPGLADEGKLIVYVSSYPLRPGPTCGQQNFDNLDNPFDPDPGEPGDPLHGVIQVLEVPLDDPASAAEIAAPEINYPGDPDNQHDWTERGLTGLEPAARACHDIAVHMATGLAAGACAEQGQIWTIDEATGIPDTANPIAIADDEVSSGGTGNIPGAIDFFHSAIFNNDGTVANWVDESFGASCPPMTEYQPRPWNPAGGVHKTGRMFFTDVATGGFLSEFQVGDLRAEPGVPAAEAYCSAHMGMPVKGINRDLLVNAWYGGGVNVIDFSNPTKPKEIAFYDMAPFGRTGSDNWSAYAYTGPMFKKGPGIPVYASDGVAFPDTAQGFVAFRANVPKPSVPNQVDHLNPQTQD